jgi:hypothetical protein
MIKSHFLAQRDLFYQTDFQKLLRLLACIFSQTYTSYYPWSSRPYKNESKNDLRMEIISKDRNCYNVEWKLVRVLF